MHPNPALDAYFEKARQWKSEMELLRRIVLETGLTETKKWYQPVYMHNESNIAIISSFKANCVLSFFKGALLKDAKGLLDSPGENSQSVRLFRFTSTSQIQKLRPVIKAYLKEAIEIEQSGQQVPLKKITERPIPEELAQCFKSDKAFEKAFRSLTPGRQRAYLLHFSQAKQAVTRMTRIEKWKPAIMEGKGWMEK